MGIEPTYPAWKAGVLPLNYTCKENMKLIISACPKSESNQRHEDFQSSALPTELSGLTRAAQFPTFVRYNKNNYKRKNEFCQ